MEEWKDYKLGDLYDVHNGLSKGGKFFGSGYPFLSFKTVFNNYFLPAILPDLVQSNEKEQKGYDIKRGDVFVTRTSETPEELGMSSVALKDYPSATYNGFTKRLRPKNTSLVYPEFIGYYLRSSIFRALFYGLASSMSTRASLANGDLLGMRVFLPSYDTQERIANILHSLDDKIEVNRRINDNLEQQAQALFKSWFVDFEPFKDNEFVESELGMIPKGWRVVSLDEMTSKFGTGLNPRKNFILGEGNNYYVTIKNMSNNRVYLNDKCDKVNDEAIEKINKRSKLQKGDLLFSGIGTIGRVALITKTPTNWNTSESVFNLHPSENVSSEFLYILLLSDVFQQYVKLHAQGGVQQGIRMASLKDYKMAIPEYGIMREFDNKVVPLISLTKRNDDETDCLTSLRDTLLPRLMAGELKVGDVTL